MTEKTPKEIDAERFLAMKSTPEPSIRSAYEATFTYHHMIVQARFATAGLFFTLGTILAAAILSENIPYRHAQYLGYAGVLFSFLVLLLDARNRHLLCNCVTRGLRYERHMNISKVNGFFGLMRGPQDEPRKAVLVSHSTAIFLFYLLFVVLFLALPSLKK